MRSHDLLHKLGALVEDLVLDNLSLDLLDEVTVLVQVVDHSILRKHLNLSDFVEPFTHLQSETAFEFLLIRAGFRARGSFVVEVDCLLNLVLVATLEIVFHLFFEFLKTLLDQI